MNEQSNREHRQIMAVLFICTFVAIASVIVSFVGVVIINNYNLAWAILGVIPLVVWRSLVGYE